MKLLNSLFLFMTFSFVAIGQSDSKENSALETSIHSLINNWHKSAADANFDTYFEAMQINSIFVGTDASEVWSKKDFQDFSKPYFDKGKAWSFKNLKRNIYLHSSKEIVWFDEILDTWMGICRGSGVVEKINNKWIIKHYVLSVTVPNEDIKPVIKIKQKRDSIFLNKLID